jgi:parvulin-like peptidyl-prolyl isomerase
MIDHGQQSGRGREGRLHRWLHEPLLHFLLLGVLLFALFEWLGGDRGVMSNRVTVTTAQVQQLVAFFTRTWQRAPTEAELKGLVDEYVREEIAYREAVAMGLDRDDTVIRQRMRQKLEFLAEDAASATPPTVAELQAYLDQHPDSFRVEPQVAFRQVFVDASRDGDAAARARALLGQLTIAGPDADIAELGDAIMLDPELPLAPQTDIARVFGSEFAASVVALEPGTWQGPVASGYGLHLVLVRERIAGHVPALEEIRPLVERELLNQRRREQLAAMYDELLQKYSVTIEGPGGQAGAGGAR